MQAGSTPHPCDYNCFDDFLSGKTDDLCTECQGWYDYWCEVDDSEMDIDWSEYDDIEEWVEVEDE